MSKDPNDLLCLGYSLLLIAHEEGLPATRDSCDLQAYYINAVIRTPETMGVNDVWSMAIIGR